MEQFNQLISFFGSQAEVARTLNVSTAAVSQWVEAGGLPAKRAIQMERITKGRFKATDIVAPSEKEAI